MILTFGSVPDNILIGVRAGGGLEGTAAPPTFGQLRFFGQQEKFGQSFLKKFPYFFEEIDIFYFT